MVQSFPAEKRLLRKRTNYFSWLFTIPLLMLIACKKDDVAPSPAPAPTPTPPPIDSTSPLKDAADFPIGVAINYTYLANDPKYAAIVKRDFDAVTFGWEMKHSAIVRNDGSKDYSLADAMMNQCTASGLSVHGHTLVWYQNNNGDYLRSLTNTIAPTGNDLFADLNGSLDKAGTGSALFDSWSAVTSGNGVATFERETAAEQGDYAVKVIVSQPGTNAWNVQFLNKDWNPTKGKTYQIKFWVKSAGSGPFRAINQTPNVGSPNFATITVTPTTDWTEVTWNYTAPDNAIQFGFHFPSAGTFWIDNITIREAVTTPLSNPVAAAKMDSVMKDWIQSTINHYKANVHTWDVVNEPFTDGAPVLRNGTTSTGDTYYWMQYLGRDYIANAFRYAKEADPNAALFLNDYNLESNPAKLDSIIALANELKAANVPITGIGTQMHIFVNTSQSGIDQMMQKLAATGLKIRVSELDVKLRNGTANTAAPTATELDNQAAMYRYVVSSYKKYIPAAQRAGITVWGVTDNTSWLYNNGADYPLMYDKDYNRKPAYAAFLQSLKN
jgi:endo-1,4-beta-xylanase